MKLEEKLVQLRKEKGLSQMFVAEAMEVSRQAISRWEVGTALPSTDNLRKLAELYGVSIDVLLNESVPLAEVHRERQRVEPAPQQDAFISEDTQSRSAVKPVLYGAIAVLTAGLCFCAGYRMGLANAEQKQEEPIPLSDLETMDWDSSDVAIGTYGWPDFGEGGE